MKSLKTVLLLLFVTFAFQAQAQLTLGLKAGYTIAWPKYNIVLPENAETDVRGMNISSEVYWRFNKYFSVGIEPGYVERGAACVPGWEPVFQGDTRLLLNQINVPVMAKFDIPIVKDKFSIYLRAGYSISYLISAHEQTTLFNQDNPLPKEKLYFTNEPRLNRFAHGAHFGFGMEYKIGRSSIFMESDLYLAMSYMEVWNDGRARNANFSAGYRFTLGK